MSDVGHGGLYFGMAKPIFYLKFVKCFVLNLGSDQSADGNKIPSDVVMIFWENLFDERCCFSV